MFNLFQQAVRTAYLDLKKNNRLDFVREWPSTKDLKNWCLQCCENNLDQHDERVFRNFFNATQSNQPLSEIIKKFDTDKLRPLRNFIVGNTLARPNWNVVKLLAVLIDFQPRPYRMETWGKTETIISLIQTELEEMSPSISVTTTNDKEEDNSYANGETEIFLKIQVCRRGQVVHRL
ncbi:hypothetical protein [Sphingobacterium sp. LRF_L2]|uniref:hypothetical protein n=1 Tax=Sphingobacterium sp. LRF_L2 TaxID=3369421 RepID=UPI003F6309E9